MKLGGDQCKTNERTPLPAAGLGAPKLAAWLRMAPHFQISIAIFWAALGVHVATATCFALFTAFPNSFDELEQLSFIRWEHVAAEIFPHFEKMKLLTPDLTRWGAHNTMTHPSPYYLLMAAIDVPERSIPVLRLVNVLISSMAVALMLATGFRVLKEDGERAVFAATLILFPKLAMMAGIINNDNAALLASAVFFYALVGRQEKASGWLMAFALAMCGWTKLTVFLMAGFSYAIFEILRPQRSIREQLIPALGVLAGLVPALVNLARYGGPTYTAAPFVDYENRAHLNFAEFALGFLKQLLDRWPAKDGFQWFPALGLVLILALAIVVCVRERRSSPVATAMILATIPTVMIHMWFSWRVFEDRGLLDMAQVRYYYGLWPGFALGMGSLWGLARGSVRKLVATTVIVGLLSSSTLLFLVIGLALGITMH